MLETTADVPTIENLMIMYVCVYHAVCYGG